MWTPAHETAFQEWIEGMRPPELVTPTLRAKSKRLKLTPEEIRADLKAKLTREGKSNVG